MGRAGTYREQETPETGASLRSGTGLGERESVAGHAAPDKHRRPRRRAARWAAVTAVAAAGLLLTACDPDDSLGSAVVSTTTDQLATHALKHDNIDVQWLSCSATTGKKEATVSCEGRTDDQQKISVDGRITKQMDDTCVRGHLTAVVGKRKVFDVTGLGDCHRAATSTSSTGKS
jgi:hypothetical protein